MYYPYLRGKQFELIALREFAAEYPQSKKVCPIIEPVKASFNSLKTAISTLIQNQIQFAIILNPHDGDFKRIDIDIYAQIEDNLRDGNWTPAFVYNNNIREIRLLINTYDLKNVMLIFPRGIDSSNDEIMGLIDSPDITYIVSDFSTSAKRRLSRLHKRLIRLDDKFREQPRNADYLSIPEESFSDEHSYYKVEGFCGFSDYTTLSSAYKESGMLPYAIAIHMTYQKNQEEIYVRHFVSDSNDSSSNIQRKFFEAAHKLKEFYKTIPGTRATSELISILDDNRYPGLGLLKKLSIKNHLELIEKILSV